MINRTHRTAWLRTSAAAKLTSRSAFTRTALLAGVLAAALGVAACSSGSSSSSSGSSGATTSGTSAAAPKGALIKIGVIGSLSGAQASSSDQGATVAPAWADWINANGGIDGHPVQVIVMDDKGDPATAQAAGQQFIADGVSAIIVSSDNLVSAFDSAAIAKGIPLIGGASDESDWYTKQGMFVTMTGIFPGAEAGQRSYRLLPDFHYSGYGMQWERFTDRYRYCPDLGEHHSNPPFWHAFDMTMRYRAQSFRPTTRSPSVPNTWLPLAESFGRGR